MFTGNYKIRLVFKGSLTITHMPLIVQRRYKVQHMCEVEVVAAKSEQEIRFTCCEGQYGGCALIGHYEYQAYHCHVSKWVRKLLWWGYYMSLLGGTDRAEPIVLKSLMIMLCCTAQEMCQLCSWNCRIMLKNVLNWYWADFAVHVNGRSDCGW